MGPRERAKGSEKRNSRGGSVDEPTCGISVGFAGLPVHEAEDGVHHWGLRLRGAPTNRDTSHV